MREKAVALKSSDVCGSNGASQLPRPLAESRQICCSKTAALLKVNAADAYPVSAAWTYVTERRRRYLIDEEYISIGFLPVGISELEVEDGDLEVDETTSLSELTSSDVVLLEVLQGKRLERCAESTLLVAGQSSITSSEGAKTGCV